jgi:hypothetical protein
VFSFSGLTHCERSNTPNAFDVIDRGRQCPLVHASVLSRASQEGSKRMPNLAACKLLIFDENSEAGCRLSKVLKSASTAGANTHHVVGYKVKNQLA